MKRQYRSWITAMAGVALLALLAVAMLPARETEEGVAGPGSPLYGLVVAEALERLAETGRRDRTPAAQSQPCPHCGQIHARPGRPAAEAAGAAAHGALADRSLSVPHRAAAPAPADRIPRYVYCSSCRVYHRQAAGDADHNAGLQH